MKMNSDHKKIICFGDSITKLYVPELEKGLVAKYGQEKITILNKGIAGETTKNGLHRISDIINEKPDYVVVGFGMNDALNPDNKLTIQEFKENFSRIVLNLDDKYIKVILLTINPTNDIKINKQIEKYNSIIFEISRARKVRLVDVYKHWKEDFRIIKEGLADSIHPNEKGIKLISKYVNRMLSRHSYIILWMYNGNPSACNYHCPYCQYVKQKGHHFNGTIEEWRNAFKNTFGNQHLIFYLAHGEPMLGKKFYDVLDMIGSEQNWEVRMTSNLSLPLNRLVKTQVVQDGRFNINGSFHPHMVKKEKFLEKLLFLRDHGIECPVVYVMYPPLFERFEEDFNFFTNDNFLVHVRRFRGQYNNKNYPEAYTEEEIQYIAKFCDDQTIKSMLFDEPSYLRLSWTGVDFFAINEKGEVGHCDDARPDNPELSLGNIFKGTFQLIPEPKPFPIKRSSDGTVDGVANFVDTGYYQLRGNNVLNYSLQGGVFHLPNGIHYKNIEKDFNDPKIRAEYHFPARNISDALEIIKNPDDRTSMKWKRLKFSFNRTIFNYSTDYSFFQYLKRKI